MWLRQPAKQVRGMDAVETAEIRPQIHRVACFKGDLPLRFGCLLLTNDFLWWIPFTLILYGAVKAYGAAARR